MLQELAGLTGATAWTIASMLFFLGFYVVIAVRVFRTRPEVLEAQARLALEGDGDDDGPAEIHSGTARQG